MIRPSTFSIVAYSPADDAWGIAVASKFPAAGAVVPWAQAGAGAVATQSHANTSYGPDGLARMAAGESAEAALTALVEADDERALRQAGMVDASGGAATFTGDECFEWAGGLTGDGYAVQGNILVGEAVLAAMAEAFEASGADFPGRLLAALAAADAAGGDRRGRQSAALLVVKEGAGYAGYNDRWLDCRVDDHERPIPKLTELLDLHRLYFGESPESERLQLSGRQLVRLQVIMSRLGHYDGPADGELDERTRQALRTFIGNENFEERANVKAGWIDRPVYEFLIARFG